MVVAGLNCTATPFGNECRGLGVVCLAKGVTVTVNHGPVFGFSIVNSSTPRHFHIVVSCRLDPLAQILSHMTCGVKDKDEVVECMEK